MPPALSHEKCRAMMCCCCGVKLKSEKKVSARLEELVKQWGEDPGYDSSISSYPNGICSTCERDLRKVQASAPEASWGGLKPPSWASFSAGRILGVRKCGSVPDGGGDPAICDICAHVKENPIGQRGKKSDVVNFVHRSDITTPPPEVAGKRGWCEECSQSTGPGLSHPCTPTARKKNIANLIEKQPHSDKEVIVGNSLKKLVTSGGDKDKVELAGVGGNRSKLKVSLGHSEEDMKVKLSTFKKIEKDMDMSRNQTLKLQKILKQDVPVEKGVREKLREWDHVADDQLVLHKLDDLELKVTATKAKKDDTGKVIEPGVPAHVKTISRDVVAVKDVNDHFDWIVEQR